MVGEDACLKLDATNTTQAGISRFLLESEFLYKLLLLERGGKDIGRQLALFVRSFRS